MVNIEIFYSPAADTPLFSCSLCLENGATVAEALEISGLSKQYPEINSMPLGIFSKPATLDTILENGDRLEIYRPLSSDPKIKRRARAKSKGISI